MTSSRRSFLAASALAAGGAAVPSLRAASPTPREPRTKLRLMVIGVGNRGAENLHALAGQEIAVLCDVDAKALDAASRRHPGCEITDDYRKILRDPAAAKELDAVVISTPDHTHFLPAMLALQQGLHVYCEKPLTQTVAQARTLLRLAEAKRCVTQMGIQIHANANYRRVVEAIRAGAVGDVREVIVFVSTDWSAKQLPPEVAPPPHLAWDLWLGPSPLRGFSEGYHPMAWRRYWAFGGGTTADMGCHFVDLAFWALDLDAPQKLRADGPEPHAECAPDALRCEYVFAARGRRPALTLRWHAGKDRPDAELAARGLQDWKNGVLFVGDRGWLISNYERHLVGPSDREPAWTPPPPSLPESPGHHAEWIAAIRGRQQPSCSFAYAVPLTETVLLANVAYRAARGTWLEWDAAEMTTGVPAADALLDIVPREGFAP